MSRACWWWLLLFLVLFLLVGGGLVQFGETPVMYMGQKGRARQVLTPPARYVSSIVIGPRGPFDHLDDNPDHLYAKTVWELEDGSAVYMYHL